jgi:hypothetical protein
MMNPSDPIATSPSEASRTAFDCPRLIPWAATTNPMRIPTGKLAAQRSDERRPGTGRTSDLGCDRRDHAIGGGVERAQGEQDGVRHALSGRHRQGKRIGRLHRA